MSEMQKIETFKKTIKLFAKNGLRDLPWRRTLNPYHIAVSEIMLQQTQVPRVIEKYKEFLKKFPSIKALATSPLASVLSLWSGLGYNRRAQYLHKMAKTIMQKHAGKFPTTIEALEHLPGIGPYTARAIAAFAYNTPSVFIETNIRTVFIHHFFADKEIISDAELIPIISATLDRKNPRQWYWLLMDYGTHLKASGIRTHRRSKQYIKQSTFKGSRRQLRGKILKLLLEKPNTLAGIQKQIEHADTESILEDLVFEGFVTKSKKTYTIA